MTRSKISRAIILGLVLLAFFSVSCFAQEATAGKATGAVTLTGKLIFMKSYGGYILITQKPHEEYKIINENAKILGDLAKQGKPVTVEGTLPKGAFLLQINKINGQPYP